MKKHNKFSIYQYYGKVYHNFEYHDWLAFIIFESLGMWKI